MARRPLLDFEKPLVELEQQIEHIRQLARDSEVDVSQQLHQLESLAARRRQEIFQGLTPAQKIQVARHPHRPSTLDFIQMFCDDWVELHGDRRGNDDQALIGGVGRIGERPVVLIGHQKGRDTKENVARNFGKNIFLEGYWILVVVITWLCPTPFRLIRNKAMPRIFWNISSRALLIAFTAATHWSI